MSTVSILTSLVKGGMSPAAACAMGGNMMAESGMISNIAQRGMTRLSDEEYTAAADNGSIDFVHDGVGYGLVQLTYYSRKQNFLNFAKSQGTSVGDENIQVQFVLKELQTDYPVLWEYLRTAKDIHDAAERICREYERPAVNSFQIRSDYADALYMQCGATLERKAISLKTVRPGDHTPETRYLRAMLDIIGYDVLWLGLEACIRDFQQKSGLPVDGICGEETWEALHR